MIDRLTVEKIKDAANIVDVVSEFVTLKKSGANYKGLCPFHNEKTPSFMVSPARGTCHCFGCGKGGNAISFIMEHEQMTYPEALRWLAKKYNIEIQERELSAEEKAEQTARESMFIINEWTASYFEKLLHEPPDGQAIGLQYFRFPRRYHKEVSPWLRHQRPLCIGSNSHKGEIQSGISSEGWTLL